MAKKEDPSTRSRRTFLKEVGTGIVGAYVATPAIKANAQNIKEEILDSIHQKNQLKVIINGEKLSLKVRPETTLAELLRDELELTGTKLVCNQGEYGFRNEFI